MVFGENFVVKGRRKTNKLPRFHLFRVSVIVLWPYRDRRFATPNIILHWPPLCLRSHSDKLPWRTLSSRRSNKYYVSDANTTTQRRAKYWEYQNLRKSPNGVCDMKLIQRNFFFFLNRLNSYTQWNRRKYKLFSSYAHQTHNSYLVFYV